MGPFSSPSFPLGSPFPLSCMVECTFGDHAAREEKRERKRGTEMKKAPAWSVPTMQALKKALKRGRGTEERGTVECTFATLWGSQAHSYVAM